MTKFKFSEFSRFDRWQATLYDGPSQSTLSFSAHSHSAAQLESMHPEALNTKQTGSVQFYFLLCNIILASVTYLLR